MRLLAILILLVLVVPWVDAQSDVKVVPEVLFKNLDFPDALAFAPDGRIFFNEKNTGTNPVHLFDVTDPTPQSTNHDGGYLKFGPDGKLYVQVGEFAVPSLSQDLSSNAGKILRMNPDGSAPTNNPFKGSLVYAYGIRNAFGMDFDPNTHMLIETEAV